MELKKYNQTNCPNNPISASASPLVRISVKGRISLNKGLSQALNLKDGDRVELGQDKQYPSDWYIIVSNDKNGFKLTTDRRGTLCFQNTTVAGLIGASVANGILYDFINMKAILVDPFTVSLDCKHAKIVKVKTKK